MPAARPLTLPWSLTLLLVPGLGLASVAYQDQTPIEARMAALEADNARLRRALADLQVQGHPLDAYVTVDEQQHTITISGANLRLVSGSGATDDQGQPRGLGNLIVGYNTADRPQPGSHNIVIGEGNTWHSHGALVVGQGNQVAAPYTVVSGANNIVTGDHATVSGASNVVSGGYAVVSGGARNTASGDFSIVSGAFRSLATGSHAAVFGGADVVSAEPFRTR